ncbi:helix-turn-helix transcriptional regulator [Janthinobacterium sp.]|uniref:helix-turn-helix transcriptional regulator n=1 Tax=Janthinobacterium sp. TaxID=1871054 RepID=UPI002590D116|nr:helix-turn-helix transcriptional regulator [Janthinobacterium sp.]MCX7289595.1 helix-turn-helix transcriptional regulator [Janthinobacterium sp.]
MTISTAERDFFIEMGERIATLRKAHAVTQVQLAEALGVSQQTVQAYEVGRRRIPVSALPVVARLLAVPMDELFGTISNTVRGKRGPMSQLERSIERISELPKQKQRFVMEMLETVLAQANA